MTRWRPAPPSPSGRKSKTGNRKPARRVQFAEPHGEVAILNITGLVHVNINCSDFERSRAFYEALGFRLFWKVPETNSEAVAAAVGMPPYRVNGGLMALEGTGQRVVIDLLEWQHPSDSAPPYPNLYHLGIARIAFSTSNMDADLATLTALGVEFVGPPARVVVNGVETGGRFVCFKDPDGTILELVEST